jgi:hypothetical protein
LHDVGEPLNEDLDRSLPAFADRQAIGLIRTPRTVATKQVWIPSDECVLPSHGGQGIPGVEAIQGPDARATHSRPWITVIDRRSAHNGASESGDHFQRSLAPRDRWFGLTLTIVPGQMG